MGGGGISVVISIRTYLWFGALSLELWWESVLELSIGLWVLASEFRFGLSLLVLELRRL